ncbi:uncharacterized protein LOC124261720 [Haliotis rubra]|uniref:uncharacterized protein LOC124261720 n=1 Tax=Haliotis rubra TaxID=36100 RepID=UPI001EE55565|nr:uncharacterized protein LOC124261720 [Haliotis rubra]
MQLCANNSPLAIDMDRTTDMREASTAEILAPPLLVLGACYVALIILWMKTHGGYVARLLLPRCLGSNSTDDVSNGRFNKSTYRDECCAKPLLSMEDKKVLQTLTGQTNTFKELVKIVTPATMSLAFCPLTLFTHSLILEGFWPKDAFPKAPNINDGIACFLVPAGMVYAISFGFAFQAVFTRHQDTDRCISEEVNTMNRIISLVSRMQFPSPKTQLGILRVIKGELIAMVQDVLGTQPCLDYDAGKEAFQDLIRVLASEYSMVSSQNDAVLRKQAIKLISAQVYRFELKCPHTQRLNPVMWGVLETLGYFNFMAMLLVQTQSYGMDLSMCIITVISISMLCYIIADLDNPFNGFFRVNLSVFLSVVTRLEVIYSKCVLTMCRHIKDTRDHNHVSVTT